MGGTDHAAKGRMNPSPGGKGVNIWLGSIYRINQRLDSNSFRALLFSLYSFEDSSDFRGSFSLYCLAASFMFFLLIRLYSFATSFFSPC